MPLPLAPAGQQSQTTSKAPGLLVPFTRAAQEHIEPFMDFSAQLTTAGTTLVPTIDVPAYGYLRGIWLMVTATGGAGTTVTANEDSPFSVLQNVEIADVNGADIVGPIGGFDAYLIHKYGGYRPASVDPRQNPVGYSPIAGSTGNFSFLIRLPVEIVARDGLGALANANASSTYKLKLTLASGAASAGLYGATAPTTQPTVRIRAWLDAWSQPVGVDDRGNQQATTPPGNGTTSYWTKSQYNNLNGNQTVRLSRVGNYIRNLVFVCRAVSDGTRATGAGLFPDPIASFWDSHVLKNIGRTLLQTEMYNQYDLVSSSDGTARALDAGVFAIPFTTEFDGHPGFELRDFYLPTVQSTRLEYNGTFTGAVNLSVLTNDVSPAGDIFV